MKSPPMHIHLNDRKEKPLRISTARQIPKHLQADAKAAIQNLIQKGVIQRIDTPTSRCSPAFFCAKSRWWCPYGYRFYQSKQKH